ncbi:hypothetical protein Pint_06785 [Pistacia integerrima]|uniref:Uncharacterized protein n=1 Tax=Pistacia integerrima TaxID=434235 RepID=A0ACC0Y0G5_9ROSI|nr:hypothetical protein Pint_06785 [Pistacia integerrima]
MKQLSLSASEESFKKIVMQHMMYGFGDDPNISNGNCLSTLFFPLINRIGMLNCVDEQSQI